MPAPGRVMGTPPTPGRTPSPPPASGPGWKITFTPVIPPKGTTKGDPLEEALTKLAHARLAVEELRPFHGGADTTITVNTMSVSPAPIPAMSGEVRAHLEEVVANVASEIATALDYAARVVYETDCRGKVPKPRPPSNKRPTPSNEQKVYFLYRKPNEPDPEFLDRVDQHFPGLRDDPTPRSQLLFETLAGVGQFSPGFTDGLPIIYKLAGKGKHEGLPKLCYAEAGPIVTDATGSGRKASVKVLSIEGGPTYVYTHLSSMARNAELAVTKIRELMGAQIDWMEFYARQYPEAAGILRRARTRRDGSSH